MGMGLNCYTMFILGCTGSSVFRHGLDFSKETLMIDCMEKVQHRATKRVYGFGKLKCEEILERLNLFSLQYMRMRGDMIETYRIISGLEDVNSSQFFTRSNMNNLHGHSLQQYKFSLTHFSSVVVT